MRQNRIISAASAAALVAGPSSRATFSESMKTLRTISDSTRGS